MMRMMTMSGMTREEAFKEIEYLIGDGVVLENIIVDLPQQSVEALRLAIADMEKQIPKKPKREVYFYGSLDHCPVCNWLFRDRPDYCPKCGQALDWSEEND